MDDCRIARLMTALYGMIPELAVWIDFDNLFDAFLMHPFNHKYFNFTKIIIHFANGVDIV